MKISITQFFDSLFRRINRMNRHFYLHENLLSDETIEIKVNLSPDNMVNARTNSNKGNNMKTEWSSTNENNIPTQSSIEAQISSRQPRHTIMQRNQIGTRNIDKQVFNQHVASSTDKYTFSGKYDINKGMLFLDRPSSNARSIYIYKY